MGSLWVINCSLLLFHFKGSQSQQRSPRRSLILLANSSIVFSDGTASSSYQESADPQSRSLFPRCSSQLITPNCKHHPPRKAAAFSVCVPCMTKASQIKWKTTKGRKKTAWHFNWGITRAMLCLPEWAFFSILGRSKPPGLISHTGNMCFILG